MNKRSIFFETMELDESLFNGLKEIIFSPASTNMIRNFDVRSQYLLITTKVTLVFDKEARSNVG